MTTGKKGRLGKTQSLYATDEETELAKAFIGFVRGKATTGEASRVRAAFKKAERGEGRTSILDSTDDPRLGHDESPILGDSSPADPTPPAPRTPGRMSLDEIQPGFIDPISGKSVEDMIPDGARGYEEQKEPDEGDEEAKVKKIPWETFVPALARIPNEPLTRERETVLRYLTIYGPPENRTEIAPATSTYWLTDALVRAGLTEEERALLLSMPQRLSAAFYTNALQGGVGLRRYAP